MSHFIRIGHNADFTFPWCSRIVLHLYFFINLVDKLEFNFQEGGVFGAARKVEIQKHIWSTEIVRSVFLLVLAMFEFISVQLKAASCQVNVCSAKWQ